MGAWGFDMSTLTAFVTDGDQRPALAITRSLGRKGIAVVVGAEQSASLASASKYCVRHVTYPSPSEHPEAFDRFVLDLVEREHIDVILPVADVTTHLVAKNWSALSRHTAAAIPSFDAFDLVANKWSLLQRAAACGIAVPRSHYVDDRRGVARIVDQVEYPAVIKPLRSRIRTSGGWLSTGVKYARDQAELLELYRSVSYLSEHPSMIQERIVGPGIGVFVLCDRGRLLTAFAHRRLREKPPSGGVSVLCESVALDPGLLDQAMRLFGPLEWHGVAMMEFKQDCHTGRPYLMEVNGRFWGSLQLAIDAGVDFPYWCCRLALGRPVTPPDGYRAGVRSRWLLGDLDQLFMRMFQRGDQRLPDGMRSRPRALGEFLQPSGANLHYDVFSRGDFRPSVYEVEEYARHLTASAARTARRLFEPMRQPRFATVTSTTHCNEESRHAGVLK